MATNNSKPHVYLLHFQQKLHHAQHYAGWTPGNVENRLALHRNGRGARLTQVVAGLGIEIVVARIWDVESNHEARLMERRLKNGHNLPQSCPLCKRREA